jgi:uncharacterized membrane protein
MFIRKGRREDEVDWSSTLIVWCIVAGVVAILLKVMLVIGVIVLAILALWMVVKLLLVIIGMFSDSPAVEAPPIALLPPRNLTNRPEMDE